MRRCNHLHLLVPTLTALLLFACASDRIAGGSQVGNPTQIAGNLEYGNGEPAGAAKVILRAAVSGDDPLKPFAIVDSTKTNAAGDYHFDSMDVGTYAIEARDSFSNSVFISGLTVGSDTAKINVGTHFLDASGTIKGSVGLSGGEDPRTVAVHLLQLDSIVVPDSAGTFVFGGLPEGYYALRFSSSSGLYDSVDLYGVLVTGGDTARPEKIFLERKMSGPRNINVRRLTGTIVVDGILDEGSWSTADSILFSRPTITENRVTVRTLWDSASLYIAYEVIDTSLGVDASAAVYRDDAAEFFLDPDHDASSFVTPEDLQFIVNIVNEVTVVRDTLEIVASIASAVDTTAVGYRIEVAIPWSLIGRSPASGLTMGVLFANDDFDEPTKVQFDWLGLGSSGTGSFTRPNLWGDLILQ